jgi:hypothetical protein
VARGPTAEAVTDPMPARAAIYVSPVADARRVSPSDLGGPSVRRNDRRVR